jgi:hypothetical protein
VTAARVLLLALASGALAAAQSLPADVVHMRYVRPLRIETPGRQAYFVVDEDTWRRARTDLGDLRIVDNDGRIVPYARSVRGAIRGVQDVPARILQPGRIGADTRFWIQVPDHVPEYNRVRLDLAARDFIAVARVEGANTEPALEWFALGTHSLFDFTRERLGASTVLQLPPTRFRYLRVTLPGDIRPEQVSSAFVSSSVRQEAAWQTLEASPERRDEPSRTVFTWRAVGHIPLEGVRFDVDPDARNFIRRVEVLAEGRVVASGTIRRVHRVHGNGIVDVEELTIPVPGAHHEAFEAVIHNGDDPALPFGRVTPLVIERRVYLDPGDRQEVHLYFGDEETHAPAYEFAQLFLEDRDARAARPGAVAENPAYTPRPDLRPWSDRHPAVVWTALALAVLALGVLALRALRHG